MGKDDIMFEKGNDYLVSIKRSGDSAVIEIRRIYEKTGYDFIIKNQRDVQKLKDYLDDAYSNNEERDIAVHADIDVKADGIDFLKITNRYDECMVKKLLCIIKKEEVHIGRLYVRV